MRYQEYRPNFFSGGPELKEFEISSMDSLLENDCVASRFASGDDFDRFSQSSEDGFIRLMAELKTGKFYVAGHIWGTKEELDSLGLPEWNQGEVSFKGDAKDHGEIRG